MKFKHIKDVSALFNGEAHLFKTSKEKSDVYQLPRYVVVSQVDVLNDTSGFGPDDLGVTNFEYKQTLMFEADEEGRVTSYRDLAKYSDFGADPLDIVTVMRHKWGHEGVVIS